MQWQFGGVAANKEKRGKRAFWDAIGSLLVPHLDAFVRPRLETGLRLRLQTGLRPRLRASASVEEDADSDGEHRVEI